MAPKGEIGLSNGDEANAETVRPLRHSMATISSRSKLGGPLSQSPLSDLILARRDSCRPCHRVTASYRALEPGKQPIVNNPLLLKTLPTTHLYIARDVPAVLFFFCRQPDHLTTCLSTCVYGKTICPSPHLAGSSTFCREPSNIFPSSAYIAFSRIEGDGKVTDITTKQMYGLQTEQRTESRHFSITPCCLQGPIPRHHVCRQQFILWSCATFAHHHLCWATPVAYGRWTVRSTINGYNAHTLSIESLACCIRCFRNISVDD